MEPDERAGASPSAPSTRDVGRALSWVGLGQLAGQVWWYGSLVALGALLTPREFGTIAAGLVVVQIGQYLMDSGTRASLVVANVLTRPLVRRALAFNIASGALLTVLVGALAGPFVDRFASGGDAAPVRFLALSIVLAALVPVPMAILQRRLDFKRQAAVTGAAATSASLAAILTAALGGGAWALAVRQVAFQLVIALMAWWSVRGLLPRRAPGPAQAARPRQEQAGWFFVVSLSKFLALQVDYLIVGAVTDARRLGIYSLAFTIAFSPVSQFSSQIGKVIFPAVAATRDAAVVARRALRATRLLALIIAPAAPPAVVLAPAVLPRLFGPEWTSMVLPFQLLLVAGLGHALLAVIQESLAGNGNVAFFAKVSIVWLAAMVGLLVLLVRLGGIRGAAVAHLATLAPLLVVYATGGARRLGLRSRELLGGLRGVALAVLAQSAATVGVLEALRAAGAGDDVARVAGAVAGLAVVVAALRRLPDSPLADASTFGRALRRRPA